MRDVVVTLIVLIGCIYTLKRPYFGVLLWSWLSYMSPHRLSWGFAYSMPFAKITAIVLLVSVLFSKEPKKIPLNSITIIWLLFIVLMILSTLNAYFPEAAGEQLAKILKIQLVTFVTMMVITDIDRLRKLIWVVFVSIGYYSVKGGVYTILTGGGSRVWGPPGSFIEDNNELAIAILMTIPLMNYLRKETEKKWVKSILMVSICLSLFTVLGSQSRGALIAICSVGLYYWWQSGSKIVSGFIVVIVVVTLSSFMPESWYTRMNTIETYEQDGSAMGRINAWRYSINAANDNLLGVGLMSWEPETFLIYGPDPTDVHAAHSIYFNVLADHGWVGLLMFLMIFYGAWRILGQISERTDGDKELSEHNNLAKMLKVSLIAYFSGGVFLSLSYFDLPWHLVSFVVLLNEFTKKQLSGVEKLESNKSGNVKFVE